MSASELFFSFFFSFPAGFKTGRGGRVIFYTKLFFFSFPSLFFFTCSIMLPSLLLHLGGGGGGLSGLCHNSSCSSASSFLVIRQDPTSRRRRRRRKKRKPKKIYFNSSSKTFKFLLSFPPSELYVCIYTRCATVQAFLAGPSSAYIETMLAVGLPSATQKTRPPCIYLSISPLLSFVFPI